MSYLDTFDGVKRLGKAIFSVKVDPQYVEKRHQSLLTFVRNY